MSVLRRLVPWSTQIFKSVFLQGVSNGFHTLSQPKAFASNLESKLLVISNVNVVQTCSFKVKGLLRRRCRDCYFVRREQRLYVLCKTHPRHKQMSMVKDERSTWILTHATQGKVRPW